MNFLKVSCLVLNLKYSNYDHIHLFFLQMLVNIDHVLNIVQGHRITYDEKDSRVPVPILFSGKIVIK